MKIISCNLNGIRSAAKKGLIEFINNEKPDILCIQEIKANKEDLNGEIVDIDGYYLYINSAVKKGYSGVAIYTKIKPIEIMYGLGLKRFDDEGRILELVFCDFRIINLYLPHGGRQKENLPYKLEAYEKIFGKLKDYGDSNIIVTGDFNIAHNGIDLARPKQNQNNIMFSEIERKQIDKIISFGFVDSFRMLNKSPGNYTWWPYAFKAKERNMGWRIDYIFVSNTLLKNIIKADIYPEIDFSDHCPIGLIIK